MIIIVDPHDILLDLLKGSIRTFIVEQDISVCKILFIGNFGHLNYLTKFVL